MGIKKYANCSLESVECLYEDNIELAEGFIKQSYINYVPANREQFMKDCEYYYSRILNYPIVAPAIIQFDFMRRCQLQCRICKIWSNQATDESKELKYNEIKILLDQACDLGVSQCYFSGGEPFMLSYLFDALRYAKGKEIFTEVTTNGLLLTKDNCRKLIGIPLNQINISVDGASPHTHDYHRNKPGLFREVINNVEYLCRLKRELQSAYPIVVMACVVTNKNFHEMFDYIKLADKLGARAFFQPYVTENDGFFYRKNITDNFVIPKNKIKILYAEIDKIIKYKMEVDEKCLVSNSPESLENLKKYFSNSAKPARYCFAGFNRIIILSNYKVSLCPGYIGSYNIDTLKNIWFSKKAEEARLSSSKCRKPCLMGSAYQPGPSVNDIFLITKRYLINLQKENTCNEAIIDDLRGKLMTYREKLLDKKINNEIEKIDLIFEYLECVRKTYKEK